LPLTARIAVIVLYFNLLNKVTNLILALLISLGLDVPKDARAIRKTPGFFIADKNFHHFGLVKGLLRKLKRDRKKRKKIQIQISIDGIPLHDNRRKSFLPILCRVIGSPGKPFVVSAFCGTWKPNDRKKYLKTFIEEMIKIERDGLMVPNGNGSFRKVKVEFVACICNAVAGQYLKRIIAHNGHCCERCTIRDKNKKHMMLLRSVKCDERTNESCRSQTQTPRHHAGVSPFTEL